MIAGLLIHASCCALSFVQWLSQIVQIALECWCETVFTAQVNSDILVAVP